MKTFVLLGACWITAMNVKAQTTCDTIVADFSHTNSGVTYYFFDESILNNPDSVYWHWNFDDGPNSASSLRNPVHYFYYEGDHIVSLTIDVFVHGVWCSKTHYDTINTPGVPLGLPDSKQTEASVYPNPTNGTFTIESSLPLESYAIYDATGKMMLQKNYDSNFVILPATISVGYYTLELKTSQGILTKRLKVVR